MHSYFGFTLLDRNYFQFFEYLTSLFYNIFYLFKHYGKGQKPLICR